MLEEILSFDLLVLSVEPLSDEEDLAELLRVNSFEDS